MYMSYNRHLVSGLTLFRDHTAPSFKIIGLIMLIILILALSLCFTNAFVLPGSLYRRVGVFRPNVITNTESRLSSNLPAVDPPIVSVEKDHIVNIELNDELKTSFMSYAVSTILGRALPDARDGLKPVHRRVLYAMQVLGLTPDSSYRKCARIVGEVLGKYHPHGDQSVYDALVRMAQDFVMQHTLVSGHGNFGSVDNDPPAAMRYTEAKLSSVAYESLLADIKEDSVDFVANFDGNEEEPVVLPARLPVLLLNGASGIAVGMATNIPPHNLGELANAVIALIDQPDLPDEELIKIIPAPDFPTGGLILGQDGARKLYSTGHGSVMMRAKAHMEQITSSTGAKGSTRTRHAIVITELPYMTNKAGLLEKIAELVNDKKLEGIADLRDETDRDGMRMVIELKKDAVPAVVQNNLFKKTALQTSFPGNMLALVEEGTQPRRITLREALKVFIAFRFTTLRRRTAHRLAKLQARDHVVQGMMLALNRIDEIIRLMKGSADTAAARDALTSETFGFSTEQAEAIMSLTLRRLTALEEGKLSSEHTELSGQIATLTTLMSSDEEVFRTIQQETRELRDKHAVPRRSQIVQEVAEMTDADLQANERSVVIITGSGYIKRMPLEEFEAQSRGGKGKIGARLSTDQDNVAHFFACNDHDTLIFITDRGVAYSKRAFQIPLGARTAKGVPLPQVLPIGTSETVTSVIPVVSFEEPVASSSQTGSTQSTQTKVDEDGGTDNDDRVENVVTSSVGSSASSPKQSDAHLVLMTTQGIVKRTPLRAFKSISSRGLTIISLEMGDKLKWARLCGPEDDVLIATKDGYACRFPASQLKSRSRKSRGVRALGLRSGDQVADIDILEAHGAATTSAIAGAGTGATDEKLGLQQVPTADANASSYVLVVTEKGYGKCVPVDSFRLQSRGGKGATVMKFKSKAGGGGKAQRDSNLNSSSASSGSKVSKSGAGALQADAISHIRLCAASDEVVISTSKGIVIRQRIGAISVQKKQATGVLLQSIPPEDYIISVDIVRPDETAESPSSERAE